jgi:rSAM/selenodomain-associated transferase 2
VSIVVPTLDEARIIGRAVARLRRLMADAEIVVADGGSTDGTRAIAARWAKVVTAPRGRGRQMNAGAAAAGGAVLLFLHADARLRCDPRPAVARTLHQPGCAAVFFTQRILARGLCYRLTERAAMGRARLGWILGDVGLAVRARDFAAVGGFPEEPLFEDLGLSRRLRRCGRFRRSSAVLFCSARRWQRRGWWRTSLLNWALTLGYYLGVPARRLERAYGSVR